MALTIWRRHSPKCKYKGRHESRCRCVFWVEGTTDDGRSIKRQTLETRLRADAERKARKLEAGGASLGAKLKDLTDEFVEDIESRETSNSHAQKHRRLFLKLNDFAEENGLKKLSTWDVKQARKFARTQSGLAASTRRTDIERLRATWRYAIEDGRTSHNPWLSVKPPKETQRPTMPFSRDEMRKIYTACDPTELALVLVMRYTGLRIGDACRLEKSKLKGNKLFLYTAKTGTPVYAVLPEAVLAALSSFPHASKTHYFWSGAQKRDSIRNEWCDRMSAVYSRSGVEFDPAQLMKSHRMRDTFACEALLSGMPIEEVSKALGHSSIKTTEKFYGSWVEERQKKMEARFEKMWADDPPDIPYKSRTAVN